MTKETLDKIKWFSIQTHQKCNQYYGEFPYHVHLLMVESYVEKYKHLIPSDNINLVKALAWSHDLIEDCGLNFNDINKIFGKELAELTFLLSQHTGRTRKQRYCQAYYDNIKENELAIFGKLCDRLANLSYAAKQKNSSRFKMYSKDDIFKAQLYLEKHQEMWDEMESIT